MNLREVVQDKYPEVLPYWLDSFADVGLVGVAENYRGQVPLYDWSSVAMDLLAQTSPREVFRKIQPMLFKSGQELPVVMMAPARPLFWAHVQAGKAMAWEMLHACIRGQGYRSFRHSPFIIYDWDAVIVKIAEAETDSKDNETKEKVRRAIKFYETKMKPVNVGAGTPVYWRKI